MAARGQTLAAELEAQRAFLDQLPDPLFQATRRRHRVVWCNQAARDLFDKNPEDKTLAELFPIPVLLEGLDMLEETDEEQRLNFSWTRGPRRELEARIKLLDQKTDLGARVLVSLHDQTDMRRANRMRADFVANASHELRTPLATLYGFIETLQGPARDDLEAHDRFLKIMHTEAGRMRRLVEDLLSLSQIEMNESSLPEGRVALNPLLSSCVDALRHRADERRQEIKLDLQEGLPSLRGESEELHQVFVNLIENAIKYGREGGEIKVMTRINKSGAKKTRQLEVRIQDDGEGIAEEHLPRLTERFYRVDKGRSRSMGGTGLGLAIVKHILSRHRGELRIKSKVGEGSTFTAVLPPAKERAE